MKHMIGTTLGDLAERYPTQQFKVGYEEGGSFFYCGNKLKEMLSELEAVERADAYYRIFCAQEDVFSAISSIKTASGYLKFHYARHNIPTKADYDEYLEKRFASINKLDERVKTLKLKLLHRNGIQYRKIADIYESIVTQGEYIVLVEGDKKQGKYWDAEEFESMYYVNVKYLYDKLIKDRVSEYLEFALGEYGVANYKEFIDRVFKPMVMRTRERSLIDEGHNQSMESEEGTNAGTAC